MSSMTQNISDKMRKTDIIFKFKPMEGGSEADPRLFTGANNLHAVMDRQTCLWHLAYDNGAVPSALKTRYTTFTKLHQAVKDYMSKRNVEIAEILD